MNIIAVYELNKHISVVMKSRKKSGNIHCGIIDSVFLMSERNKEC